MQRIRMTEYGSPSVLTLEEAPAPEPGPGQVLVRVEAAGVNFADVMRRRNDPYPFPTPLPFTPGGEVAGTVEALGDGVDGPPVGTPVFALVGNDGSNGYAQFAVANAPQVIPIPPGLPADEAAGLVVAGATAALALTAVARLQAGETVLVEGAGGGVGQYAVQLARGLGATVIGAAGTPARREAALAAGADHVVDYTTAGWPARVGELTGGRGADVVVHLSGASTFEGAVEALAHFGRLVVIGMAGGAPLAFSPEVVRRFFYEPAYNQSLHAFNVGLFFAERPDAAVAALSSFLGQVATGQVKVPLTRTLPLAQAAEAHRLLEEREATGKLVLKPWA